MKDAKVTRYLERMCQHVPHLMTAAGYGRDTCILQTRVGISALALMRIPARPLPVKCVVMNAPYRKHVFERPREEHDTLTPEEVEAIKATGAWSVQLGLGPNPLDVRPRYDGHLLMVVKDRWVVDLSLDQASRPDRDINLHPFVIDAPAFARGKTPFLPVMFGGTSVVYTHHDNHTYLNAPDWTMVGEREPLVQAVAGAARGATVVIERVPA